MIYSQIKRFFSNPLLIIGTVVAGVATGIRMPGVSELIGPIGQIFMSLLELSLLPIIFAAIALSLSTLLNFKNRSKYLARIIFVFASAMVLVSLLSTLLAVFLNPAQTIVNANNAKLRDISISASIVDRTLNQAIETDNGMGFVKFLVESIPNNIFESLSQGKTLQVLVFSVIIGIAIGFLSAEKRQKTERFLETVLTIFQKIIMHIIVWLPIAIFSLMASESSKIGIATFVQMGSFVLDSYILFVIIFAIATIVLIIFTRRSLFQVLSALKTTIFIAFGTRSAIASIPSMIYAFENTFKADPNLTKLLVPMGAVIGRFGNIAYAAFCTIFIAGIYHVQLTGLQYLIVVLLSVISGLSATGATGILTLSLLTIVLNPLQLPLGAVLPLLIAVDAIIDPIRTLTLVYVNAAVISVIVKVKTSNREHKNLKEKPAKKLVGAEVI